ncbi:MAG: lysophospholipid acyltransferase family protein [Synergistaceae bacterium]|jgi:KDO2-lipid IV(A) lauroyltransferase|nr:lysophospholipid acyltransferase family protein [Synergistaceae bacterium]
MAGRQPFIWAVLRSFMFVCGVLGRKAALKLGGAAGKILNFFSFSRASKARSRCVRMLGVTEARAREIVRDSYVHFGKALVEFIMLPETCISLDEIVAVTGEEHVRRALELGRGVILLSAHIGCWEYAAAALAGHGLPMSAIGAEQRDDRITNAIAELRAKAGVKPVAKGLDLRAAIECLKRNEVLAVLFDQDAKSDGVLSPFLGHLASTPTGPIKLARKYGTPVLPAHIIRGPDGVHMSFFIEPALEGPDGRPFGEDVRYAADRCNETISKWIMASPEQWMWMYPRWESTLNDR